MEQLTAFLNFQHSSKIPVVNLKGDANLGIIRFSALWNDQGEGFYRLDIVSVKTRHWISSWLWVSGTHTHIDGYAKLLIENSHYYRCVCVCVGGGGALLTEQKISNKFIFIVNYELLIFWLRQFWNRKPFSSSWRLEQTRLFLSIWFRN